MSRDAAYDDLLWAVATGAAVTAEHVDVARQAAADLGALADDVSAGAYSHLPCEPTQWRSDAGDAYAIALADARLALVAAATTIADAAQEAASLAWRLEVRLDEQNAVLAAGPSS
ncbi:hypothetical protein [Agromyces salentinus]|uniref:Uncharacterized protein n=1 Tax=Agromyces salentinus TaxID=269421 RepID=A0ABN2MIL2_9MICO|nr:hypothetical protein [Agromyces salentinus]